MSTDGCKFDLYNQGNHSPHVVDYFQNILKRNELPPAPRLGSQISIRFHDKTRDRFLELLQEALRTRRWNQKIVTES